MSSVATLFKAEIQIALYRKYTELCEWSSPYWTCCVNTNVSDKSNFIHIQDLGCQINESIRTVWGDQIPKDRVTCLEVEYWDLWLKKNKFFSVKACGLKWTSPRGLKLREDQHMVTSLWERSAACEVSLSVEMWSSREKWLPKAD